MAKVSAPFFSSWASGSLGKKITVRAFGDNKFVIQKYKSRAGKRHEIQDLNAAAFGQHAKLVAAARKKAKTIAQYGSAKYGHSTYY